jgi:YggT family protein
MFELLSFFRYLLHLYYWVVIASIVLSWLLAFNVVNYSNPFVRSLWQAMNAVVEPVLAPIRRWLPNTGVLDLSPIVLLVGCVGIADFLIPFLIRMLA